MNTSIIYEINMLPICKPIYYIYIHIPGPISMGSFNNEAGAFSKFVEQIFLLAERIFTHIRHTNARISHPKIGYDPYNAIHHHYYFICIEDNISICMDASHFTNDFPHTHTERVSVVGFLLLSSHVVLSILLIVPCAKPVLP